MKLPALYALEVFRVRTAFETVAKAYGCTAQTWVGGSTECRDEDFSSCPRIIYVLFIVLINFTFFENPREPPRYARLGGVKRNIRAASFAKVAVDSKTPFVFSPSIRERNNFSTSARFVLKHAKQHDIVISR